MPPVEARPRPAVRPLFSVREWTGSLARMWRRSLRFRTIVLAGTLTALAILATCVWMALAIQNDLFSSRRDQVLADARRAASVAQATLESSDVQADRSQLDALMRSIFTEIIRQTDSSSVAIIRAEDEASQIAPLDFATDGRLPDIISAGLRERVAKTTDSQWWQSFELPSSDARNVPGIVVGQQLRIPEAGKYGLYISYDLSAANQTLLFVQNTLWLAGVSLVALIGVIVWLVTRTVTVPVEEAAETSARFAEGDFAARIPVHGEDELATLGRSFNAMADSIERHIKDLAELSLVQQRFVSDVSHELRTPLTTIRLASEVLHSQSDDFEPTTARTVELLHTQVQRFELLLADLLEISRYDAGSVQLELEPTSMAGLAQEVVDGMQQLAEQHGSELRLVAPGGYSPVDMDPRRVRRVVRNLIGNAIEHGEGGPIVVTVDSNQQAVALGVRDWGVGIAAADIEHVFDRFWRADPSRKRTIGGTGLGLAIALGDAHLHGGLLEVWSSPGEGAHFVLTIPRVRPWDGEGPIPVEPSPQGDSPLHDLGMTQPIRTIQEES